MSDASAFFVHLMKSNAVGYASFCSIMDKYKWNANFIFLIFSECYTYVDDEFG